MAAGHPLTDADRWPQLDTIAGWITADTATGIPGVVTCSALKRSYRDTLPATPWSSCTCPGREQIEKRLTARLDHYMPASLLDSTGIEYCLIQRMSLRTGRNARTFGCTHERRWSGS